VAVNQRPSIPWSRPDVRIGAAVAVAVAIAFIVWLIVRSGGGSSKPATTSSTTAVAPKAASESELRSLAVQVGHPIYWAGPEQNRVYELTQTASGRIYIRYLPRNVPIGIRNASYTIVGTYPVSNAYSVLKQLSKKSGETSFKVPGGGFAVYDKARSTNVYLAYRSSNVQIEVYDPSPTRAKSLITSGQIAPVR
jgi:hypothetical protein